jgi:hypothetical protein
VHDEAAGIGLVGIAAECEDLAKPVGDLREIVFARGDGRETC